MRYLIIGILLLAVSACTSGYPRGEGSILVIAIPDFRADDLGCGASSDSITPQLDIICAESVRFTHAYTTSTLSNPALASILTGLYPVEHGVHRNDASRYTPGIHSLPQVAAEMGMQSVFVTGGVPALRKAAISKGFDDFDDAILSGGTYYRPADQVVKRLFNLLDLHAEGSSFFGVLELADLSFQDLPSLKSSQSERREGNYNGKLQEIDDAIGALRTEFKKMKIWDQLTVVIVGLQGQEGAEHDGLSKGISLFDEIVRVPLLVKPGHKPRDLEPSWKIDEPVNLADLGATLFDMLNAKQVKGSEFPVRSFINGIEGKDLGFQDRPLFCESDLPAWRDWGPRLVSMRVGKWLYWPSNNIKLFNTVADRLELHNLYSKDYSAYKSLQGPWNQYKSQLFNLQEDQFRGVPVSIGEKLKAAKTLFSRNSTAEEKDRQLTELELRRPDDWQVVQWHIRFFVETENRSALRAYLKQKLPTTGDQRNEYGLWHEFSQITSGNKDVATGCFRLVEGLKKANFLEMEAELNRGICEDPETRFWLQAYIHFKEKKMKEAEAFFDTARGLSDKFEDQMEFSKAFWIEGAVWDFKPSWPEGPTVFEMFLTLAHDQDFQEFVKKKQLP